MTTTTTTGTPVSRRSIAKGVAWAVPAITAASVVPAFAASYADRAAAGLCQIIRVSDSASNGANMRLVPGLFGLPGNQIPVGTVFTWDFTVTTTVDNRPYNPPTVKNGQNIGTWTISAITSTPATGAPVTSTFRATFKFTQATPLGPNGFFCLDDLKFADTNIPTSSGYNNQGLTPGSSTVLSVVGTGYGGAPKTTTTFNIGAYNRSGAFRPLAFSAISGYPNWIPQVELQVDNYNSSTNAYLMAYCTSNVQSTWNTTCYNRCYQNHGAPSTCPNGTNGLVCIGASVGTPCTYCGFNTHTTNTSADVSTCGQADCSSQKCCASGPSATYVNCVA